MHGITTLLTWISLCWAFPARRWFADFMSGTWNSGGDRLSGPDFCKLPSSAWAITTGGQSLASEFSVVSPGLSHELQRTVDYSALKWCLLCSQNRFKANPYFGEADEWMPLIISFCSSNLYFSQRFNLYVTCFKVFPLRTWHHETFIQSVSLYYLLFSVEFQCF